MEWEHHDFACCLHFYLCKFGFMWNEQQRNSTLDVIYHVACEQASLRETRASGEGRKKFGEEAPRKYFPISRLSTLDFVLVCGYRTLAYAPT